MLPDSRYINSDFHFWATVRLVSEYAGYSERTKKTEEPRMKLYTEQDVANAHAKAGVRSPFCFTENGKSTKGCDDVLAYLNYRSDMIENHVSKVLLDREGARSMFERVLSQYPAGSLKIQMNKQTKEKCHPSYLVNTVNLIAQSVFGEGKFDDDPQKLTIIENGESPVKVLSKRMDGAYPSSLNPRIIWEVKEYYGTTTFGSRISDGVYETMLAGFEIEQVRERYGVDVKNVLFVDDRFTWWQLGRSYVCRLFDLMHMGYVDAVFFGKEVEDEWRSFLVSNITM